MFSGAASYCCSDDSLHNFKTVLKSEYELRIWDVHRLRNMDPRDYGQALRRLGLLYFALWLWSHVERLSGVLKLLRVELRRGVMGWEQTRLTRGTNKRTKSGIHS